MFLAGPLLFHDDHPSTNTLLALYGPQIFGEPSYQEYSTKETGQKEKTKKGYLNNNLSKKKGKNSISMVVQMSSLSSHVFPGVGGKSHPVPEEVTEGRAIPRHVGYTDAAAADIDGPPQQ